MLLLLLGKPGLERLVQELHQEWTLVIGSRLGRRGGNLVVGGGHLDGGLDEILVLLRLDNAPKDFSGVEAAAHLLDNALEKAGGRLGRPLGHFTS